MIFGDWFKERWNGALTFRWTDDMTTDVGTNLDSVTFADIRLSYNPNIANDAMTFTLGFNNVFDEDPSVCFPCGIIGMSQVLHDIPGRVGYIRFSYER